VRRLPDIAGIRAVCFDLDGLLVDSEPLHFEAQRRALAKRGLTYTLEDKLAVTGGAVRNSVRTIARKFGIEADAEALYQDRVAIFRQLMEDDLQLRPGAFDLLQRLRRRKVRCAVVTSGERDYLHDVLDQFEIDRFFVLTISADDVQKHKPDPPPYVRAAERLRLPPAACLALEDSRNGLLSAKAAGMACFVVPNSLTMHQDFALADGLYDGLDTISDDVLDRITGGD
jgi:HAD superfamily hydrolase (TIGR01509 family)